MVHALNSARKETRRSARVPYRIYISVNGEGYGHSSRALAVASYFDPDCVVMGSYGYVLERLQRAGYRTVEVGPEFRFIGEDGTFELSKTIIKNSAWPLVISRQTREETRVLKEFAVTCVLSDCRAAPVFAAAKLGLPCIFMTNQTQFDAFFQRAPRQSAGRRSRSGDDTGRALQEAILAGAAEPGVELATKAVFRQVDEFAIGDFPPPDTVCLPLLSHKPSIMKLQRFVGPITAWRPDEVMPLPRHSTAPYVVGTLGGHQWRLPLFQAMIDAARHLPEVEFEIFSTFRQPNVPANVRITDFTDRPERFYKSADLVVTQAGHSTAMELLCLGKPSLLIPDYKQIEQESNAARMVELGVASQISYPELSGPLLARRIQHHLQTRSYELNALRMARQAARLNGAQQVAETVIDYALRVLAY